jgi:dehydrogenase/reductase SDR family member 7B
MKFYPMKNKVVIITGASSGIGKALAEEFAARGAKVVIAARNTDKLKALEDELKKKNGDVFPVTADVSKEDDCRKIIAETIKKYGTIDILINNAGISMRAIFADLNLKVIEQVMNINFWGTVYCTKHALPYLLKNKGSVVGVSSIAGYKGLPGRTGYSASKFAMQGFLETLRIENLKKGLHVLIACPGYTASNIRNTALAKDGSMQGESPLEEGKLMTSEEVAKRIVNAIEKRKDRLVMTTEGKLVVLLNKFFPKFMDKMVFNKISREPDSPVK